MPLKILLSNVMKIRPFQMCGFSIQVLFGAPGNDNKTPTTAPKTQTTVKNN